jgi:hypothetical protein
MAVRVDPRLAGLVVAVDRTTSNGGGSGGAGLLELRVPPAEDARTEAEERPPGVHFVDESTASEVDLNDPHVAPLWL